MARPRAARKRPAAASLAARGLSAAARKRPAVSTGPGWGQQPSATFTNPILPGGFPDPSICRVGDDFYLANSSFEYFPGLPIHHSRDLLNWTWVGYGLDREEQVNGAVNLTDVKSQDGIQAPSLRYRDGTFYIIATCVYRPPGVEDGTCTNFVITASDIRGPWSQPHVIEGAPGIDPDIFFDDDGRVWYVGTHAPDKPSFGGEGEIWCQELDLSRWCLTGERHYLWRGACHGGVFVEGPHLYKHEGMYYLLVAEGGTGVNHAVMIASSDKVTGPYFPNERNPVLTSRNLSYDNWVHSTGHADLFQVPDGRWFLVLLGIRGDTGQTLNRRSNMGRETFLVPVEWEREPMEWSPLGPHIRHLWPVAAPGTGRVERSGPVPLEGTKQRGPHVFRDDFESPELHPEWVFRRVPRRGTYSLATRPGFLRLFASPQTIQERAACSLLGVRQRESDFVFRASMEFSLPDDEAGGPIVEAGICLFQKDDNYLACTVARLSGVPAIRLIYKAPGGEAQNLGSAALLTYRGSLLFEVVADSEGYTFRYGLGGRGARRAAAGRLERLTRTPPDLIVSTGYTGACLGFYCTSNGGPASQARFADFAWAEHRARPRTSSAG